MPAWESAALPVETCWALRRGFCLYLLIPHPRQTKANRRTPRMYQKSKIIQVLMRIQGNIHSSWYCGSLKSPKKALLNILDLKMPISLPQ